MLDFSFLSQKAGFSILQNLLPYSEQGTYLYAFAIAFVNTLACCTLALPIALLIAVMMSGMRLSSAPLMRFCGTVYVSIFRNVPLLLWILLFYKIPVSMLPTPESSWSFWQQSIFINNRGIYVPSFDSWPTMGRYNIENGWCLLPEFWAPTLALALYSGAFMAENIRGAILSVSSAYIQAGRALGLSVMQVERQIVYPIALRTAYPALIGQMMNLVKNSSLAAAVGFPEIMQVIAGTSLNQTGKAIEIMLIIASLYLFLNISLSLLLKRQKRMG